MIETIGNYDESLVGQYTLPEIWPAPPKDVKQRLADWPKRRGEILRLFEQILYGRFPRDDFQMSAELFEEGSMPSRKARRKQFRLTFTNPQNGVSKSLDLLLVLPQTSAPVPCLCGLNFRGNHTTCSCPEIPLNPNWICPDAKIGMTTDRANEASRGKLSRRWPFDAIVEKGFAVATAYYGDVYPDHGQGWRDGLASLFPQSTNDDAPGAISYWAWGLCAIRKFLATLPDVQSGQIYAAGHSRLGKASLWAAANDEGFAGVCSNDSGCCGAKLSRRYFGEYPQWMAENIPYWFCPAFQHHAANPNTWPVDQHMLLAAIAPRRVLVNSAVEDNWADPHGEELSAIHASSLFAFLEGRTDTPISNGTTIASPNVKYHIRPDDHDMLLEDWQAVVEHFGG